MKYLRETYDPFSQAFLRYGSGAAVLLAVSALYLPGELRKAFSRSLSYLPLTCVLLIHQVCWTTACYGASPAVAQLTTKLSVVIIIFLSFVLFREERSVIRSPFYLGGTALSFAGVAAVLMPGAALRAPVLDFYSILLLIVAMTWSVYVVWAKHLVTDLHPVAMFAVLASFTTIGLGLLSLTFGHPSGILAASRHDTVVVIVSGIIPIAGAHPSYHYAQKYLGSALCSSVNLLNPIVTYLLALAVFPGESLSVMQWIGGAILLAGTFLVTWAGRRQSTIGDSAEQA
ncbi:MAG: DMT family transporter [Candidatus Hydrogenedentes bacterium]|nr:DMT family transporter [Candidatus Hydrogenedentota bacterium]